MAVLERVNTRATTIRLLPALLSLLAAPFVALGWTAFWAVTGVAVAARWTSAAFLVGYEMARERRVG